MISVYKIHYSSQQTLSLGMDSAGVWPNAGGGPGAREFCYFQPLEAVRVPR
jgi:hypothetical protein